MFKELTIDQFTDLLASDSSVPGGGSASALTASIGVSLVAMVASLTIDKKGYEEHWDEMKEIKNKMEDYRNFFLNAMDEDAESYARVIDCFKLPKDTDNEKEIRAKAIQDALYGAALVPLEIADKAAEIFPYVGTVVTKGNKNALSDGAVAALMARAAVKGAVQNVEINANSLKDEERKSMLMGRSSELMQRVDKMEEEIMQLL